MRYQSEERVLTDYEDLPEDSHVLHLWEPLPSNVDSNYSFVHDGFLFNLISSLLYVIVYPILWVFTRLVFDFRIEGKENLKAIDGAKITVSNHVHFLDCVMSALANFPKKTYFTSLESNFQIPLVHTLITLLNAIPIPEDIRYTKKFVQAIDKLLSQKKTIHFYPESSLWPYYDKLRHFKNGAFDFAVRNQVPIVTFVFHFTKPTGIRKFFKKKPFVHLTILPAEYPNSTLPKSQAIQELKNRIHQKMQNKKEDAYVKKSKRFL